MALTLPHTARAMCEGAPEETRAKLEDSIRKTGLVGLDASYLCQDDLCMKVRGAPPGSPDLARLTRMLSELRAEEVATQKRSSQEQRLENCKDIITRFERVKSADPEKIIQEMSDADSAKPAAPTVRIPGRTICMDIAALVQSTLEESDKNQTSVTESDRYKRFSEQPEIQAFFRAASEDRGRGVEIPTIAKKVEVDCTRKWFNKNSELQFRQQRIAGHDLTLGRADRSKASGRSPQRYTARKHELVRRPYACP